MRLEPAWCWRKRGVRVDKQEAELSEAPALLDMLALKGRLVTGDALYCQRQLCQQIVEAGGDYLMIVKENQPRLYGDIALLFAEPPFGEKFRQAEQYGRHGDRKEVRRLWASTGLREYLDWPGLGQVLKIERIRERKDKQTRQIRYAITSLGEAISAEQLSGHIREHWKIENRLHYVRDVTFGEDASQIRTGSAPQVMAALRNVVLSLLRRAGVNNVAAALRQNGWQRCASLKLLGLAV